MPGGDTVGAYVPTNTSRPALNRPVRGMAIIQDQVAIETSEAPVKTVVGEGVCAQEAVGKTENPKSGKTG